MRHHPATLRRLRHVLSTHPAAPRRHSLTRRAFLRGLALGAGALTTAGLSSAPRQAAAQSQLPSVAIIGAGAAGLTCAYALAAAGITATVYEAGERPGGRIHTLDLFGGTGSAEAGGEFIDGWHTALLDLAEILDLPLSDRTDFNTELDDAYFFAGQSIDEATYEDAWQPIFAALDADYEAYLDGWTDITYDNHPPGAVALDTSASNWMARHALPPLSQAVLTSTLTGLYGRDPQALSALLIFYMLEYLQTDMLPTRPDREGRTYQIAGGNQRLTDALAARLPAPALYGHTLRGIIGNAEAGYTLTIASPSGELTTRVDRVVLAVAFPTLRDMLLPSMDSLKRRCIDELGYGTNAKLFLHFDPRTWQENGFSGELASDLPLQMTWETLHGQAGTGGILVNYLGGEAGLRLATRSTDDRAAEALAMLEAAQPGSTAGFTGQAYRVTWSTLLEFKGSYACYLPGQMTAFRGIEGQPVGGLHFAGEHTSLAHQGYMNGAVESGLRAAREIAPASTLGTSV